MNDTTVVNIKYEKYDVYCGRGSIFGNPYKIGRDGTRDDVCDKYNILFQKKLQDPKFRAKVMSLKGKRLGCHCKPFRCHVETIRLFIENEARKNFHS